MVPAKYPAESAPAGAEGPVVLETSIEADGSVGEMWALESPDPVLEEGAMAVVKQWRYEPATLNGKKVRNRLQVVVEFKLR
jgi:protein TonB